MSKITVSSRVRGGNASGMVIARAMMAAAVAFVFTILSGAYIQHAACAQNMIVITTAVDISNQIKNYPEVKGTDCNSLLNMISNGNSIIQNLNFYASASFGPANVTSTRDVAIQFIPVVGPYDSVIDSARSLDPNNATSVTQFYENIFQLALIIL